MPIAIPDGLPAVTVLREEGVDVITSVRATRQDIRPLQIAILNIMPTKIVTETQLLRLLGASPLQIEVTLLRLGSHVSKNTSIKHLTRFYKTFEEVSHDHFDCLIITGAPVETLPFSKVRYWTELQDVFDWSVRNVYSTLHICWGAQAGLYHHYNIPKYPLDTKVCGVFAHVISETGNPLFRGFDDVFSVPHSRHTEIRECDVIKNSALKILSHSAEVGVYLVGREDNRQIFITGHPEYSRDTLRTEYVRDMKKGLSPSIPQNYFAGDNPDSEPIVNWRSHSSLLVSNWINEVYQKTPFDLRELQPLT